MLEVIIAILVAGCMYLSYDAWTKPNYIAGKGTVIVLGVSLVILSVLMLTQ